MKPRPVLNLQRAYVIEKYFTDMHYESPATLCITSAPNRGTTGSPDSPDTLIVDKLTEREIDVLRLLAKGLINQEIAEQLHLSVGTVRNRVSAIFTKLEVQDRTQSVIIAIHHGLAD